MRHIWRKGVSVGLLVVFVTALAVSCSREGSEPAPGPPKSGDEHGHAESGGRHEEKRIVVLSPEALEGQTFQTTPVQRRGISPAIRVTAAISPNQYKMAHISPRVEGRAIAVMAELGDRVRTEQTLAVLDSMELGERKAGFLQARTNLVVAKRNFEREQRLFKQRISSEKDYLDAKGEFERSLASYQATREALRMIGVPEDEIRTMRWDSKDHPLSHFHLTAPFPGTLVERHIRLGEVIEPADRPFTVADLRTVWVLLDIFETDLARVSVGAPVRITVDAYPDETFEGAVTYVSNLLDPSTRTAEARVETPNPEGRLRPGMFATATLTVSTAAKAEGLVVPETAVQRIDEEPVAFVEQERGRYEVRHVTLGAKVPPHVEIQSGLQEGELVVTEGSFYLKSALLAEQMGGHAH